MKIDKFVEWIEKKIPLENKEIWDNIGLLIKPKNKNIKKIIFALTLTDNTIETAFRKKANLIITHHPIWLNDLKKISYNDRLEYFIKKLSKKGIGYYSMHTNFDFNYFGMTYWIAKILKLENLKPLKLINKKKFIKLEFKIQRKNKKIIIENLLNIGLNLWENCEISIKPSDNCIKKYNKINLFNDLKVELIIPKEKLIICIDLIKNICQNTKLKYSIIDFTLNKDYGVGGIGYLHKKEKLSVFLKKIKKLFKLKDITITKNIKDRLIERISFCGGSGKHLLSVAIENSDCYLTGDLSYHDFEEAYFKNFPLIDFGHYNSEVIGFKEWWKSWKDDFEIETYFLENEGCFQEKI